MSAIAAHYSDRRYSDLPTTQYDPATYFSYSQPSLNAVTASTAALDGTYGLAPTTAPSYLWDTHGDPVHSPASYSTSSSSSLTANANPYPSSSTSAHSGPQSLSNLASYPPDYASHRSQLLPSRTKSNAPYHHLPALSSSNLSATSSRSSYASGTRSYSSLAAAASSSCAPNQPSGRLQDATWDHTPLYTMDPSDSISSTFSSVAVVSASTPSSVSPLSEPATSPPPTPIKTEDPEGNIVFEVSMPPDSVSGAMPEVPLRATHAVPEMKKMMCVFRLENFAIHDGIRSAATQPGSGGVMVGPLEEKPVELEWQVHLSTPLVVDDMDDAAFRYGTAHSGHDNHAHAQVKASTGSGSGSTARRSAPYKPASFESTGRSERAEYVSVGSASPALSVDYPSVVDSESWDASSGYSSVTGTSSGSGSAASVASPTFASVMTPAQSLGWSLRYQTGGAEVAMEQSSYRRQATTQSSLSRVSQTHGQYLISGGSKSMFQQQPSQYSYDSSSGYSRNTSSASRYADIYASSSSAPSWYRS